jgi:hypothetical protein
MMPMADPDPEQGYLVSQIVEAESDAGDIEKIEDWLPSNWDGKFKCRLYPIERLVSDMNAMPESFAQPGDALAKYAEEGVTHLALLESEVAGPEDSGYKFGVGGDVKNVAMLVTYAAERGVYRFIHCVGCARTYLYFIGAMQIKWDVDAVGHAVQAEGQTVN